MRTTLETGDLVTVQILSKKMLPKAFASFPSLKARYYDLISCCNLYQGDYLSCAYSLLNLLEISSSNTDINGGLLQGKYPSIGLLEKIITFIVLSQHSPEQHDLLLRMCKDERVIALCPSSFFFVLESFKKDLLIEWRLLLDVFGSDLKRITLSSFSISNAIDHGTLPVLRMEEFDTKRHECSFISKLKERTIEHNLRVVSKYYKKISLNRLSDLILVNDTFNNEDEKDKNTILDLVESHLSNLITKNFLSGKIDRITGIISFGNDIQSVKGSAAATSWTSNVDQLLEKVVHVSNLLAKEENSTALF